MTTAGASSERAPVQWDWVPDLVASSAHPVSHGLCELCFAYYYGPAHL